MKLLIEKKSGKKFPPPFDGEGYTAIAVGLCENGYDPKHRQAYVLENGQFINCDKCCIIKDLERLKKGVVQFAHYNFPHSVEENAEDTDMVYLFVHTYDFVLRDMDEKLIPLPISLNYIDGNLDNKHYDLDKVLEVIKDNPSRFVTSDGGDANLIKIHNIPYYNADEDRTKFIDCKYLPTDEEYSEYIYGNHYLRYDKIVDKWFSKCKKEVVD